MYNLMVILAACEDGLGRIGEAVRERMNVKDQSGLY